MGLRSHYKSATPFGSMSILFMAALLYAAATGAQTDTKENLASALEVGEESLLRLLLNTHSNHPNPPSNDKLKAVNALLTLFDLQDELNNRSSSLSEADGLNVQDDRSALDDMQTLLTKVIQDSCDYINITLHDITGTTDETMDDCASGSIRMRQTFECTREAAKKLQAKLELLLLIRNAEREVLSLPEFLPVISDLDYYAWIDRGNFNDQDRRYLECVADSIY